MGQVTAAHAGERLVAIILTGNLERHQLAHKAFEQRMKELPELVDVVTYVQTPNADPISLANSIRKAVGIGSELIICHGTQAALVAKKEARNTPVLFADVYDPVTLGLVRCIDDVSCEISGISGSTPIHTLLKALLRTRPFKSMGILYSESDAGSLQQYNILKQVGPRLELTISAEDVQRKTDIIPATIKLLNQADILFVSDSPMIQQSIDSVLSQATKAGALVISQVPGLADKGALMTLEPNPVEQGEKLAEYAHSVLSGGQVHKLPVVTPQKVDLTINLKVAREHKLKIPFDVLTMTTRVIK